MGLPYPGHDVAVIDDGGTELPPGETGEIAVRVPDPVAFLEYLNAPEATAAKFVGPWLRTGDLASRDADGYLWFKGRSDDLIISAGYRISPVEVEQCLLAASGGRRSGGRRRARRAARPGREGVRDRPGPTLRPPSSRTSSSSSSAPGSPRTSTRASSSSSASCR